jgi:hypothetical protein
VLVQSIADPGVRGNPRNAEIGKWEAPRTELPSPPSFSRFRLALKVLPCGHGIPVDLGP